jgi:hypothetical protein
MRCPNPNCPENSETVLKYCRACGGATVPSGPPAADAPAESAESAATAGGKDPGPGPRAARGGRARPREFADGGAAYHRSIRVLARAVYVGNALTMVTVIGLALIFSFSQQALVKESQARLVTVIKEFMVEARHEKDEAVALVQQKADANYEKLKSETAQAIEQVRAENGAEVRKVRDEFSEKLLAALPAHLTERERQAADRSLASLISKSAEKNDRRLLVNFRQKVKREADRRVVFDTFRHTLGAVKDPGLKTEMEDKVRASILGE